MAKIAIPKLIKLRYGAPYCTGCKDTLHPGWLVAYWPTRGGRKTIYCAACTRGRVEALRRHGCRRRRTGRAIQ